MNSRGSKMTVAGVALALLAVLTGCSPDPSRASSAVDASPLVSADPADDLTPTTPPPAPNDDDDSKECVDNNENPISCDVSLYGECPYYSEAPGDHPLCTPDLEGHEKTVDGQRYLLATEDTAFIWKGSETNGEIRGFGLGEISFWVASDVTPETFGYYGSGDAVRTVDGYVDGLSGLITYSYRHGPWDPRYATLEACQEYGPDAVLSVIDVPGATEAYKCATPAWEFMGTPKRPEVVFYVRLPSNSGFDTYLIQVSAWHYDTEKAFGLEELQPYVDNIDIRVQ